MLPGLLRGCKLDAAEMQRGGVCLSPPAHWPVESEQVALNTG